MYTQTGLTRKHLITTFDVVNLLVYKLVRSGCQKLVSEDTKSTVKRKVCKDFMATGVAVVAKSLGLDKQ